MSRRRIIEGTWTCSSCDRADIPGRLVACPSCGNPRDDGGEIRFDFGATTPSGASTRETVTDAGVLAVATAGADWFCAYCQIANRQAAAVCAGCGAARDERAPPAPKPVALVELPPTPAVEATPPPAPPQRGCLRLGCASLVALFLGFLALGYWAGRTHEEPGRVTDRSWEREIRSEQFVAVVKEGWRDEMQPRAAIMPVAGSGEVAGVEHIRDCERRQHGTRRVADGTETVCHDRTRSVQCGTEERCHTKDLGNGFAEEICDDVPKYCSETYQECREETRWRDEPVYGELCRYDTWEWQPGELATARGSEESPSWPDLAIGPHDRAHRHEAFRVDIAWGHNETQHHQLEPTDLAAYEAWRPGQTVVVVVDNLGKVQQVRPAP